MQFLSSANPLWIMLWLTLFVGCASNKFSDVRDGMAPVENGQLYFQVAGTGEPVVLIHGNAGDHRHWNSQFQQLSTRFRVIRYDVRGYGQSSEPIIGKPYSDSSDLSDLMDHLGVNSAHIVGWSFGSGVAFDFAVAHPQRTKSIVSVGPWINGFSSEAVDELFAQMGAVSDAVAQGGAIAGSNAFVDIVLGDTIFDQDADRFMRQLGAEYSWWAFSNPSQIVPVTPSAAMRIDGLDIPILVVTAEHDLPVCQEAGEFIVSNAPNAHRIVMKDTGHLMHIEQPRVFNSLLLTFWSEST